MITGAICDAFKADRLAEVKDDVFKIALYTTKAVLSRGTQRYTPTGEVTAEGYQPGGQVLTGTRTGRVGESTYLEWKNPVWDKVTLTARGALIYDTTRDNGAVAVLDFRRDVSATSGRFEVDLPAYTVRI